jgi:acyl-[acyl-carrier-protein]-phospholipid O-acyltransferase/long-chain-fatty-acid--[acyl-carrier-protein] ligase
MIPHIKIEESLTRIIGANEEEGLQAAVTAVPDDRKGERLIVIHTPLDKTPEQLCAALAEAGLPNLYIPSQDSFHQVDQIPVLGTGKLDLRGIKEIALKRFAGESPSASD